MVVILADCNPHRSRSSSPQRYMAQVDSSFASRAPVHPAADAVIREDDHMWGGGAAGEGGNGEGEGAASRNRRFSGVTTTKTGGKYSTVSSEA